MAHGAEAMNYERLCGPAIGPAAELIMRWAR
jgi:hypothetical protein